MTKGPRPLPSASDTASSIPTISTGTSLTTSCKLLDDGLRGRDIEEAIATARVAAEDLAYWLTRIHAAAANEFIRMGLELRQ